MAFDLSAFDSGAALVEPEEQTAPADLTQPTNLLLFQEWIDATPEKRVNELADVAFSAHMDALEADKTKKVKTVDADGNEKELVLWGPSGEPTTEGMAYFSRAKELFQTAAQDPDGGIYMSELEGKVKPANWTGSMLSKPEKQVDPLADYSSWLQERQKLATEDETAKLSWEDYVDYANADITAEEAKIDVNDKRLKSEWARRTALSTFSPDQMDESEIGRVVGGQMVINPLNYSEIDKVEAWIAGQEKFSASEKKLNLLEYRKKIEQIAGELVNQFSAADAGVLMSIGSSPLRDEFMEAASKPGFSAYQFLKDNKERFSKDSYGIGSEVVTKLRDAVMATGTGALFLAGKAFDAVGADEVGQVLSKPAEAWGGLAEDSARGFANQDAFSIGGIDVTRRDLTELAGQIGSFVAMGGLGSLGSQALFKGGLMKAPQAAALVTADKAAELAARSFGKKALDFGKATITDTTAYAGSLQAAGMSFGRTFDQQMKLHGNREKAYSEASIQGLSDGLSAFVATSVMNRFGMGMEKALDAGEAAVSGGLIQNIRTRIASKEGMEAVKKTLADLKTPGLGDDLQKVLAGDILKSMNGVAKGYGLKGLGIVGDVLSEGIEESADELLSTVFQAIQRDSSTWTEESWKNISANWQQYVKAGILGAIGGGMGAGMSGIQSPVQTFGKSEGLQAMEANWKAIKLGIEKFDNRDTLVQAGGKAVPVAEMLATALDANPIKDIEMKSAILRDAAVDRMFFADTSKSIVPSTPPAASSPAAAPSATPATSTAPRASQSASKAYPEGSLGSVMSQVGIQPPAGRDWDNSASVQEDKQTLSVKVKGGDNFTLTPVHAVNATGRMDNVGAKVVRFGADGKPASTEYVSAATARDLLSKNGRLTEADRFKSMAEMTAEEQEIQYEEWTQEQGTGSDGAGQQKPAAVKADSRNTGAPEGNGDSSTERDGGAESARRAEAALSGKGLSIGGDVSLTNAKGVVVTGKVRSVSESKALTGGDFSYQASVELEDGTITSVDLKNPYLSPAKESTSKPLATIGRTDFNGQNGAVAVETTSEKNGKKYMITAEPGTSPSGKSLGRTKWIISGEDSKTPGEYSGSIPMENDAARELAVKALGKEFVQSIENAHQDAEKNGMEGSERAVTAIEQALAKIKSPAAPDAASTTNKPEPWAAKPKEKAKEKAKESADPVEAPAASAPEAPASEAPAAEAEKKTPQQKIAKQLADSGETADEKIIEEEYAKTEGIPKESRRISKTLAAVRERIGNTHRPLPAASVDNRPEAAAGLDPDATYIVNSDMIEGGTDEAGATWSRKPADENDGEPRYGYKPPAGSTSTIDRGDVVVVAGNKDMVLILEKVVDGELIFRAIELDPKSQTLTNQALKAKSAKYTRSMLDDVSALLSKKDNDTAKSLIEKLSTEPLSPEEMRKVFEEVLAIVAPRNNFKVKTRKLPKGKYLFAEPAPKGSKAGSVIVVDFKRMAEEMHGLYRNSDTGNQFAQELLAYDAASFLSSALGEEGIHILTYQTFTPQEIGKFYSDIWNLNEEHREAQETKGVAAADVKDHPIFAELKQVAVERGIKTALDPFADVNPISFEDRHLIAGELMRKLVQMSLSGTTTERQAQLSRMLQAAMIQDAGTENAKTNKGIVKYLKSIGHMIRRYAERMRTILWVNWQRGMLPEHLQAPLARLIQATKESGMNVDVFDAHRQTLEAKVREEELHEKSLKSEISTIARNNSFPMRQLRERVKRYGRISMDEAIVHDPVTMEIGLDPDFRVMVEKDGSIDLVELDKQFDKLNGKGGPASDQTPAMKKVMTNVFLKWQKMQLLRDALPARFSASDLWTGAMNPDREGITRVDRDKLFERLFSDLTGAISRSEALAGNDAILSARMQAARQMRAKANFARNELEKHAKDELSGLDLSTISGMKKLVEWSRAMKLNPRTISLGRLNRGIAIVPEVAGDAGPANLNMGPVRSSSQTNTPGWFGYQLDGPNVLTVQQTSSITPEELNDKLEAHRKLLLQRLPMWSDEMHSKLDKAPFGAGLKGEAASLFKAYKEKADAYNDEAQSALRFHRDRSIIISNYVYDADKGKVQQASASDENYRKVVAFARAVDDYNNALKMATYRAIGDFGVRNVGHGTSMQDTRIPTGTGSDTRYLTASASLKPVVYDPSDESLDVIQDVYLGNVFPMEHGEQGYEQEGPYSYASKFIYPEREQGAVSTDRTTGDLTLDPYARNQRPSDDGLTESQREWNAGLEIYRTTMQSNAAYAGRTAWADFWVAVQTGQVLNVEAIDEYMFTGGFNFEKTVNPEDESIRYEKLSDALPDFDHQKLGKIKGRLAMLKRISKNDNAMDGSDHPSKVIAELFDYLEEVRQWSEKIRSLYQGDGFVAEIGGIQTVAGRALPVLDQAFSRAETVEGRSRPVLTRGLDMALKNLHNELMAAINGQVLTKPIDTTQGYLASAKTIATDQNGLPRLLVERKSVPNIAENLVKQLGESNVKLEFDQALYEAVQAVNLVRKQTSAFMDRRWRRNVEHEGSRMVTDAAYVPDYEGLLKMREVTLNPRVLQNLSFAMSYFEKQRDYHFSPNWGFEMLDEYTRLNFGEGREPFTKPAVRNYKRDATAQESFDFAESGETQDLAIIEGTRAVTEQEAFDYAEAGFVIERVNSTEGGVARYVVSSSNQWNPTDEQATVLNPDRDPYNGDDPRVAGGNMTAEGSDFAAWNQVTGDKVSSRVETAQRRANSLEVARGYRDAKWAVMLGSNTAHGRNSNAGRSFYFDLLQAEADDLVSVEQVLEARTRMGSRNAPSVRRMQTVQRFVEGNALDFEDSILVEDREERLVTADEQELRDMDPSMLRNYFRVMRNNSLVERGLRGLFPEISTSKREFLAEIKSGFLTEYGNGETYEFATIEKFLHDLAEFKAGFERHVIDRALVRDDGVASMALQTVLTAVNVEELDAADPMAAFAAKVKSRSRKAVFKPASNTFASEEEARNIWKLAHAEAMKPKAKDKETRIVVDVSAVPFLNSTVGPIIEQILLNLPGNTIAIVPDQNTASKHGLQDVGIRIFEGRDGNPNVIYVPQDSSMRDKRSAEESTMAIAQGLSLISKSNSAVAESVSELAAKVRRALDPVVRAESIYGQLSPEGKWNTDMTAINAAVNENVLEMLNGTPVEFTDTQITRIKELVTNQFLKSIELARELQIGELTADQYALFGGDVGFASDLLLVGTILSNAKAKQFFDQAYSGMERLEPSVLPSKVEESLMEAIMDVARSGEVEGFNDTENITEDTAVRGEQDDEDLEASQRKDETLTEFDLTAAEINAAWEANATGDEMADPDAVDGQLTLMPEHMGFSDAVKKEIGQMIKDNGGTAYYSGRSSIFSDADIALINGISGIVAKAMDARKNVAPLKPSRDAREILLAPSKARNEIENEDNMLADPVIASTGWREKASKIYVGEGRNLGRPSLPGNRTSLTAAFARERIKNMSAAVLQLSPYVRRWTALAAGNSIRQSLNNMRQRAVSDDASVDYDRMTRFARIDLEIEVTDRMMDDLRKILPAGEMELIEREVADEIKRLESDKGKRLAAKARIEEALVAAKMEHKVQPAGSFEEDSFRYARRFADYLGEMLTDAVEFEETRAADVAQAMTGFVRKQFGKDPFFREAFSKLANTLDEIENELGIRSVISREAESDLLEVADDPFKSLTDATENANRIGDLIRSYNANVAIVNLSLDAMAAQAFALLGHKGSTKGFRLPQLLGNADSTSIQDVVGTRRKVFGIDSTAKFKGLLYKQAENGLAETFRDGVVGAMTAAEGKTKAKTIQLNPEVRNFIRGVRALIAEQRENPDMDIGQAVMAALNGMTERMRSAPGGKAFTQYVENVFMTFAQEDALYDRPLQTELDPSYSNKGQTAFQRDRINKLEIQLGVVERGLLDTQAALDQIDHTDYRQYLGRAYYRGSIGLKRAVSDKNELPAVGSVLREAGVNLTLIAPGMGVKQAGLGGRAAWSATGDVAGEAAGESTPAGVRARRRAFWTQKETIVRALAKFSGERLEDSYRDARNADENFVEFDPLATIRSAVEMSRVEAAMLERRFSQAKDEAAMADLRGMNDQAVAVLTDPKDSKRYEALTRSQKNAVNVLRLPQSIDERRERIGRYHTESGMSMILLPTTARDEMMRAFPEEITKKNINTKLEHYVLAAISPTAPNATPATNSYFFQEVNKDTMQPFKSAGKPIQGDKRKEWRLAKPGASREEVANAFADEFEARINAWMNRVRNKAEPKDKKTKVVDMTGPLASATMSETKFMIRHLVLAYTSEALEGNKGMFARQEIERLLAQIDDVDADLHGDGGVRRSFTYLGVDPSYGKLVGENMQLFNPRDTFSKVFSAVEADLIAKRLVAGMTISNSPTDLTLMRLAHHHDARIRNRFRKSLSAKQAARHLAAVLDHGIDGNGGREGYETARTIAKEKIGNAADKVGSSAKNHAIGYLLAQLNGIKDAHGVSLRSAYNIWVKQQTLGYKQSGAFVAAQDSAYGKNKFSKYWSGGHIDLVRDQPLADELQRIMRKAAVPLKADSNEKAALAISVLETALRNEIEDGKGAEVQAYVDTLGEIFRDVDAAMHFSMAMSSKKGEPIEGSAEETKWKNGDVPAFKETASSVPMRLGYAKEPKSRNQGREGRFIADPIEVVSMDEAAFFGGIAKGEAFERNRVYRPIMINGLSTPLSIVDDAIYRINITPTYEILRRSIGKVRAPHGPIEVVDSDMMNALQAGARSIRPDESMKEYQRYLNERHGWLKEANTALAAVAFELETIVQNDSQIGTANTGGAEVMRFMGAQHIVRSLASPLQWWDQTASPSVGYAAGKLVAGRPKSVAMYFQTLAKMLTNSKFRGEVRYLIKEISPYVYYRASDGQDVAEDVLGNQERYGRNKLKAKAGRAIRWYERLSEKTLSLSIGMPERMLAGTIFMVELAEKMEASSVTEVIARKGEIDKWMAQQAKLKVNDILAQSDQAKKSWFFQTRDQSPVMNAFWRSLVRFSNHTASMSSNTAVMTRSMFEHAENDYSEGDIRYVSKEDAEASRKEAMENIATTLTQNILFYPMKLKNLLPMVLYLIFKAGGDDDDRAAKRAQKVASDLIAPDKDAAFIHKAIMALLFGKERELFQDKGKVDEAQASAFAEILNRTMQELVTTVPLVGVAFGYSPINGAFDKMISNRASEEISAMVMDVKREKVRIREYQPGFLENAAELAAPAAAAYDYAAALKLVADYNMTRKAGSDRGMSLVSSMAYLLSEVTPMAREPKSYMKGVLQEPVWKEEKRKR